LILTVAPRKARIITGKVEEGGGRLETIVVENLGDHKPEGLRFQRTPAFHKVL